MASAISVFFLFDLGGRKTGREESWSGLPFPSPEDLPDPGIEPSSPALQGDALPLNHLESPWSVEKTINSPNGDLPQDGF